MNLKIDDQIHLELIAIKHAQEIFNLVDRNRTHLKQHLSFVDKMQTVDFAINFAKGTIEKNKLGIEYAFVIYFNNNPIGRIGIYKIDLQNKIAEIGYWLDKKEEGKGIISKSLNSLIKFCFDELKLNRIEIKCGIENSKSNAIPIKFNFKFEGVIRQGEFINNQYIDLNLYSLLREEMQ